MTSQPQQPRVRVAWRVTRTVAAILMVQTLVVTMAALPSVAGVHWLVSQDWGHWLFEALAVSAALGPAYVLFALCLMTVSPLVNRLTRARTPDGVALRLADFDGQLLTWARYLSANHLVRLVSGALFRGSPIWTWYLRLNGARIGRRVYVNTLYIADHNLLTLGDDVVIGSNVHLSGHTVENGELKTSRVSIGSHVTIGLGSVIDIGATLESGCTVGALSFVPKHARLEAGGVYAGVPVRRLHR